jgi:FkbM family methyltransferase
MKDLLRILPRDRAPVLFRLAKALERKSIRGSSRLLQSLRQLGWLDRPVDFRIGDSLGIVVPIARNGYDRHDLDNYEMDFLEALSAAIRQIPGSFTLLDCGADIGVFSIKLLANCPSISRIVAFEPNVEGFPWLELNLGRLSIPAEAIPAAVADFQGTGRLAAPETQWTPGIAANHTQYFLEPVANGPINVTMIDLLAHPVSGSLVIKLDLEGGELAAVRGASRMISTAPNAIVAIEAHPGVTARTGVDPVECLRFLASLRPFQFSVGETGLSIDAGKSVFDQISPNRIYNLIARSS